MHFTPTIKGRVQKSTFYKRSTNARTGNCEHNRPATQTDSQLSSQATATTQIPDTSMSNSELETSQSTGKSEELNVDTDGITMDPIHGITKAMSHFHFSHSDNSFRFDFGVPESGNVTMVTESGNATMVTGTGDSQQALSGVADKTSEQEAETGSESVNYFKMERTDNNFRFGFQQTT